MYKIERIVVRPRPGRQRHRAIAKAGNSYFNCLVGRGGIGAGKREGDGKTPIGSFTLLSGYYRADRISVPKNQFPFNAIAQNDGWCDDPGDPNYNRYVRLPYQASHEKMAREDGLYDICMVMDYNIHPTARNRGSAIFLHLQSEEQKPTEGCLAFSRPDLMKLLPRLSRKAIITILPG